MSKLTLVEILKEKLDEEGGNLKAARKDRVVIGNNLLGVRQFRLLIASQIKELKAQRQEADRNGGGNAAGSLQRTINYLRSVLNELTEELTMIKLQRGQCGKYIKQQEERVRSVDAEWEQAKANATETAEQA